MKQLKALDASIEKWRRVVFKKEIGLHCPLCDINIVCGTCVIDLITGESGCKGTPFYNTSVGSFVNVHAGTNSAYEEIKTNDSFMLSKLYEIRLEYINGYHKGLYE